MKTALNSVVPGNVFFPYTQKKMKKIQRRQKSQYLVSHFRLSTITLEVQSKTWVSKTWPIYFEVLWFSLLCKSVHNISKIEKSDTLQICKTQITSDHLLKTIYSELNNWNCLSMELLYFTLNRSISLNLLLWTMFRNWSWPGGCNTVWYNTLYILFLRVQFTNIEYLNVFHEHSKLAKLAFFCVASNENRLEKESI